MSGDLEDFLRRAAQRRQAKSNQQSQPKPVRQRPQYSDRKTERVVDAALVEEPLIAELVDDYESNSLAAQQKRLQESRQAAARAEAEAAKKLAKLKPRRKTRRANAVLTGFAAEDLLRLLSSPQGVRQAILLREVLERPEHRW